MQIPSLSFSVRDRIYKGLKFLGSRSGFASVVAWITCILILCAWVLSNIQSSAHNWNLYHSVFNLGLNRRIVSIHISLGNGIGIYAGLSEYQLSGSHDVTGVNEIPLDIEPAIDRSLLGRTREYVFHPVYSFREDRLGTRIYYVRLSSFLPTRNAGILNEYHRECGAEIYSFWMLSVGLGLSIFLMKRACCKTVRRGFDVG
jgi:hypothetical protein